MVSKHHTYKERAEGLKEINANVRQRVEKIEATISVLESINDKGVHDLAIKSLQSAVKRQNERIEKNEETIGKFEEKSNGGI